MLWHCESCRKKGNSLTSGRPCGDGTWCPLCLGQQVGGWNPAAWHKSSTLPEIPSHPLAEFVIVLQQFFNWSITNFKIIFWFSSPSVEDFHFETGPFFFLPGFWFTELVCQKNWGVVSNIFHIHPYLGKIPILTHIFQMGWNHQPGWTSPWKPLFWGKSQMYMTLGSKIVTRTFFFFKHFFVGDPYKLTYICHNLGLLATPPQVVSKIYPRLWLQDLPLGSI